MDRINLKCLIAGQEVELQLDRKAMPGEAGPCFMIAESGCFKGYIAKRKNGQYENLGTAYYSEQDIKVISRELMGKLV